MKKKWLSILLMISMVMTLVTPAAGISFAGTEPSIAITSALLNNQSNYDVGEAAVLRYTVTPAGSVEAISRPPVDTVLVLDVSNSMDGAKLTTLKNSAKEFVKYMKANRVAGDKITLISFHTYASQERVYSDATFSGLETAIDNLSISGYYGNNGGTNYEDALVTAKAHFKSAMNTNSIVFFSDGVPTFYDTNERYYSQWNQIVRRSDWEMSIGGPGNMSTWDTISQSQSAASQLKNMAQVYTISLGSDQTQHDVMKNVATDASSALISPGTAELTAAFTKIAQKVTAKEISNIKVRGTVPMGMTMNESSLLPGYSLNWINESTYEISVPNVTFPIGGITPSPFSFDISFTINSEGTKTLGAGYATYSDTSNGSHTLNILGIQIYVSSLEDLSIAVTSALLNNQSNYGVGESGVLKYTITPAGSVTGINRQPVDTVLVLDVSNSMSGTKLTTLKSSAKAFVQHMKANGVAGDKITLMDFHTYSAKEVTYVYPNFSGIEAAIDNLSASRHYGINGGTNYEDALVTANRHFGSVADTNSVVFFSDGVPTYYDDNNRYEWQLAWDYGQNKQVYQWVRRSDNEMVIKGPGNASSSETINQAQTAANDLKNKAKVFTISLGSDQSQHNVMKNIATDAASALISPGTAELTAAFKKIAEKVTAKEFTNIKIRGSVPEGLTVNASSLPSGYSLTWISSTTYEIAVPNVIFPADGSTPSPVTFDLPFTVSTEGTKVLGTGTATYTNTHNGSGNQEIPGVTIYVYKVSPPVITPSTTLPTNQDVKATVSYPGTTTEKYYKVVAKGVAPDSVSYTKTSQGTVDITVTKNETTIYAYSMNKTYKSPVTTYTVNNIDKVLPAMPIITEGTPSFNGSSMSVDVSILYSSDAVVRQYRISSTGVWTAYTDKIPVTENGTVIEARGKDAAGNYSLIASHTVSKLISSVTNSSITTIMSKDRILSIKNGSFVVLVTFLISQDTPNHVQMVLNMDKNSSLFSKMVLPTTVNATDGAGETITFSVVKNASNGTITIKSLNPVSAGEKNYILKMLVKFSKVEIGSYIMEIGGSTGEPLKIDVVKNPPIK